MSLSVIGAGIGRTGTTSLKLALEHLGFGPCYHMQEVLKNPPAVEHWLHAAEGSLIDWDEVFAGYNSTTDWPASDYWQELSNYWPEAKIILTVRDAEAWFSSTQKTIFGPLVTPNPADQSSLARFIRSVTSRFITGPLDDHARCIEAYERHNANVQLLAPPDRLLVFDVAQGWEPLCQFLGVPVPSIPFPTINTTDDFQRHIQARMLAAKGENAAL